MRMLVTGAAGSLGRHVSHALAGAGHDVVRLDTCGEVEIMADITKIMPLLKCDAVIHLAALASPNVCATNPRLAFDVNVHGTQNVLRLALESGAKGYLAKPYRINELLRAIRNSLEGGSSQPTFLEKHGAVDPCKADVRTADISSSLPHWREDLQSRPRSGSSRCRSGMPVRSP